MRILSYLIDALVNALLNPLALKSMLVLSVFFGGIPFAVAFWLAKLTGLLIPAMSWGQVFSPIYLFPSLVFVLWFCWVVMVGTYGAIYASIKAKRKS